MFLPFVPVLSTKEIPSMMYDHMRCVYQGHHILIDAYFSKFKVAVVSLFKKTMYHHVTKPVTRSVLQQAVL